MNLLGNLLIAPPAVKGNFWHKTVIMITEQSPQGTLGIVLNKQSQLSIRDFGEQLGMELDLPGMMYVGGPVSNQSLTLLHSTEWLSKNTLRINKDFSLSSADDILPRLRDGDEPEHWRLFLGMCGWAPGQLQGELAGTHPWKIENSWCLTSADLELTFESDGSDQWCAALDKSANEFAQRLLT